MLAFYQAQTVVEFMSIFVIDEQPLTREGLVRLIRRIRKSAVTAELDALGGLEAAVLQHGQPEMVCVDLQLFGETGISAIWRLRQLFPESPLLVFTAAGARDYEKAVLEAGADIFLHKSAKTQTLSKALRSLMMAAPPPEVEAVNPPEKLSKRQKQLLVLLDKGKSNRDIAELLEISEHTVKVHLWRLFRRLNVKSRSQASHLARTNGLL